MVMFFTVDADGGRLVGGIAPEEESESKSILITCGDCDFPLLTSPELVLRVEGAGCGGGG